MSEKTAPPADKRAEHDNKAAPAMSSYRAILTFAAFLALPLGFVYIMSQCNQFAPSTSALSQYQPGYRHPHATTQAKQSMLENIGKLMAEAAASPSIPHMRMRFCAGEDLRDCAAYKYDQGCTKIEEHRVLSLAEPGMFEGAFNSCTVFRRGVQDCEMEEEGSFKHVKDFVVNWYTPDENEKFASNGVVPLLQKEWISDIGSFKCR